MQKINNRMTEQNLKKLTIPPHNSQLQLSEAQRCHLSRLMEPNLGLDYVPQLLQQKTAVVEVPVKLVTREVGWLNQND